ncbi:MAG: DUF4832 domain-containing protein [Cytophagaceae bacterium]|nr:DUF4832 domain-containing protein [Cytophagaceae bacterium]
MKILVLILLLIFNLSCVNSNKEISITYQPSDEDFPNPERGFYRYSDTHSDNYSLLSENALRNYRNPQEAKNGKYEVVSTLVFRYFVFNNFQNTALDSNTLENIRKDFQTVRAAGVKIIPRFTYTISPRPGDCPTGFACPPYGDANKEMVLKHIEQLKPILNENADVIACVQMGFIGIWGENYYTDFFGDASTNATQGKLLDKDWQDRIDVLKALLNAIPKDIMVQVRYPQFKQRYVYGINSPVSALPLTESEAFTDSEKARIGFHNDCFMASEDNFGTYTDYGNSETPSVSAITPLRKYMSEDSRYVVTGGETCSDGYSPQNDCEPQGKALQEIKDFHYSYLNADFNNEVNNDWAEGGCINDIARKLGYRIMLKKGMYPESIERGKDFNISIELENIGYASPFKARSVEFIMRNKSSGETQKFNFDTDVRKWYSGPVVLKGSFQIKKDFLAGEYELLLNLPDKYESLKTKPEYSIRLANEKTWEPTTGFNKLNHTLIIK